MSWATLRARLAERSWHERWLLVCAALALAAMRLALLVLPFRVIATLLGLRRGEQSEQVDPASELRAEQIGRAVRSVAAHTPWPSTCLVQALAAAALLRVRGLEATLYLGVARDAGAPGELLAHAWLRCGGAVLTGAAEAERFHELVSFAVR